MKKLILAILLVVLVQGSSFAEEKYWYPEGKWHWGDQNTAYVLKEYDKNATSPGCIEWLGKTGFDRDGYHTLPGLFVFMPAVKEAKWGHSTDSMKPMEGSIVYWDLNPNTSEYKYAIALIRKIDGEKLTIEYWSKKENKVMQYTRNVKDMRVTPGGLIFRGYIYPNKDGK